MAVQNCSELFAYIPLRHRFCTATWWVMLLPVIESLVTNFSARKRVPLLYESSMCVLCNLDQSFVGRSLLAGSVVEVFTSQTQYHGLMLFASSHDTLKVGLFTGKTTVWTHASASTPPGPSVRVRLCLQSQLTSPFFIRLKLSANRTSAPFPMSRPHVQADGNKFIKPSPTARESRHQLKKEPTVPSLNP